MGASFEFSGEFEFAGGRDSKPELKTSNTKPETGIKGKPEPKKGMQRARGARE